MTYVSLPRVASGADGTPIATAGVDTIVDAASTSACATMISMIYWPQRKLYDIAHECVRHRPAWDLLDHGFDQPWTRVFHGVPEQSEELVGGNSAARWYSLSFG